MSDLHEVRHLFGYTRTNIDEMLARYTSTSDLERNYYSGAAVDAKFAGLSAELMAQYDWRQAGWPLSAWVSRQIEAMRTKAVELKGVKASLDELPVRAVAGMAYEPKVRRHVAREGGPAGGTTSTSAFPPRAARSPGSSSAA